MLSPRFRRILKIAVVVSVAIPAALAGVAGAVVAALPLIADTLPLTLPRISLTDGRRTVELQGMIHVARPGFYDEVAAHVAERRAAGWIVMYEQVRSSTPETQATGMTDLLARFGAHWTPESGHHVYEDLSTIIGDGLVLQNNGRLLGAPGPDVRNVDITMEEVLAGMPERADDAGEPVDLHDALRYFDEQPAWVRERIQAAVRLRLMMPGRGLTQRDFPQVITERREALVTDAILAEPGRNILVIYGAGHLAPVASRLQAADPAWTVTETTTLHPL